MKLKLLILTLLCSVVGWGQTVFTENMYNGTGGASGDAITTHEANDRFNEDGLTYSGTGDMRNAAVSTGYLGASGTWNAFFNNANETFIIDGINAGSFTNLIFSFGIRKNTNVENGSGLIAEYSTTGISGTYTQFTYISNLPIGVGSVGWYLRTSNNVVPNTITTIRFRMPAAGDFRIDDLLLTGTTCTPPTISTVYPTSGPEGTEVTITASAGSLAGATATFGGVAAIPVSSSTTQLIVKVPTGGSSGNIVITDGQPCTTTTLFTVINKDASGCEGSVAPSDLILYEIHDEKTGTGGTITIFNGTAVNINLTNYSLWRATNQNTSSEVVYATLTGNIPAGGLGIIKVNPGDCGPTATNGSVTGGFNENDGIQLRNAVGTIVVDDVDAYVPSAGYYMKRNAGSFIPRTNYVASDWTTVALATGVCAAGLGSTPTITSSGTNPIVSTQPTLALTCSSTNAVITVVGAEGFAGGNALTYQWFAVAPNTTTWTALTNAGVYSGATAATLTISSLAALNGYQYYCQVRENTATCYVATVAVKINIDTTIWNGVSWSNGTPSLSKAVIIDAAYNTGAAFPQGSFDACSIRVNLLTTLTIAANTYVNIQNQLNNGGTVTVQNNGSLVQINNTPASPNTGNITVQRSATGVVSGVDYVYWSAPVASQNLGTLFSGSTFKYSWGATSTNANGGQGNWNAYTGAMNAGNGYIVRDISSANFTGAPHNGIVNVSVNRGTDIFGIGTQGIPRTATDDNWNLLGNPYPSALDAISTGGFLDANPALEGFVKVWRHLQAPTNTIDPFYQNFVSNYYAADYENFNRTGLSSAPGEYKIASGQGFMVLMVPGAAGSATVTFNNGMRNKDFANNQFFRNANTTLNNEKNRMWLDFVSPQETSRILIGYVEGATNEKDRMYDAFTDYKPSQNFYSLIQDEPQAIQGKALPFSNTDLVPLGFKVATAGSFTIAIGTVDGLFANNGQTIYLEDKLLDVVHNLSTNPYTFNASAGIVNNRFVIRYTDRALSTNNFELVANNVAIFSTQNGIKINSLLSEIKSYAVYNMLGQILSTNDNVNTSEHLIKNIQKNSQVLLIKATLKNGQSITKKVVY